MSRKQLITTFACVLATTAFAVGCGTSSNNVDTTNAQQSGVAGSNSSDNSSTKTSQSAYPITMTDDSGEKVTIPSQPKHIVSGTEGTDEILLSLVPKSRIAMVTNLSSNKTYSNVVQQVSGIPQMANADAEKILSVHPDLVLLASYVKPGVVDQVRNANVPVYEFNDFTSMSSIEQNIQVIGKLVGASQKAGEVVKNMQQNLAAISKAVAGTSKPSVLDYSSYGFAAGKNTTVNDIIQDAGGVNAASSLNGWQKLTDEEIIKMNPKVIIDSESDQAFLTKLAKQPDLQSVSAIKNHRLYAIPDADLTSVSQYIVKAVADVAQDLHPNANLPQLTTTKVGQ